MVKFCFIKEKKGSTLTGKLTLADSKNFIPSAQKLVKS